MEAQMSRLRDSGWLTVAEAAEELGVSTRRITKLCQQRRLGERVGGKLWLIYELQLDEFKRMPRQPGRPKSQLTAK
jgi:excisionase family DNA binding protein